MLLAFGPLYVITLFVIFVAVLAPVIAAVVFAVMHTRRRPPALKQAETGGLISADGQWEWNGRAWVPRSE